MEFEHVLQLIEAVSKSELTQFQYDADGVHLCLKKQKEQIQTAACDATVGQTAIPPQTVKQTAGEEKAQEQPVTEEGELVKSPLVGIFYAAPAEDAAPFVKVGDTVKKGQTLAIVEAMKLMNEIESESDGTVAEIFVENGQAVEYGQSLFRIS
ncbi:MAG: acetyl-CoA carboxylase biotin carboxyl carrier protein [Candidatus Choladocola sp.]|nr:acetyl-CoA carboxylase biotin carboxyl carrier protein [Candidatus Choladocola sp.]